jgi:hypothetical protein
MHDNVWYIFLCYPCGQIRMFLCRLSRGSQEPQQNPILPAGARILYLAHPIAIEPVHNEA